MVRRTRRGLRKRHIAAVMIGGIVEYYDFVVFTFFAIQIGKAYFPASSEFASLMLSLATFGIGFAMRPLGGMILGAYADRAGRRAAMTLTLVLMGLSIVALAVIPPYAAIGIAAPILAVIARLVQGFALGGEDRAGDRVHPRRLARPPAWAVRLVLRAVLGRRRTCSARLSGWLLSWILTPEMLEADGWRIAFLLGALTLPLGVWLRRSLPETCPKRRRPRRARRLVDLSRARARNPAFFVIMAVGNIGFYIFQYATTYAQNVLHMPAERRLRQHGFAQRGRHRGDAARRVAGRHGGPQAGVPRLADRRRHRRRAGVPVDRHRSDADRVIVGITLLAALSQIGTGRTGSGSPNCCRRSPRPRYGTTYGLAVALFGGTAQMVVAWLIQTTGATSHRRGILPRPICWQPRPA
jgi:MFS family permease